MCDKNSLISNICVSDSEISNMNIIWRNNENCLPVMGSGQVSSILSTLEHAQTKSEEKVFESTDTTENMQTFKSIPINIINLEAAPSIRNNKNEENNLQNKQLFQEMLYFGCNLCPFICTKDSKISDHVQSVHQNKNYSKKPALKCPGCSNIFYHKLSLRSHLIHDHEVGRSDINKIVNSIVYMSALGSNNTNEVVSESSESSNLTIQETNEIKASDEITLNQSKLFSTDVQITDDDNIDNISDDFLTETLEKNNEATKNTEEITNFFLPKEEDNLIVKNLPEKEEIKKNQKCFVSTCAVRMSDVSKMAYHSKCHYDKIFKCLECNEMFSSWKTLQTHLWRVHNIDMELYSCDQCNYKTFSLAKLNNIHKLIHGNEKSFLCDLCGKGYKNPKQLRNHKRTHKTKNLDKMLKCEICERKFSDKRMLKVHIDAVHQKIKPYSCNYCSYKAASSGALKLHVRLHTGLKPFSCDQCAYSTSDHNSLRRHKSRHSNEKKYKCAHCDYACIQSSTYKTHLKTKHPGLEADLMFSCNLCQFRSLNKDKYNIHMLNHKPDSPKNYPEPEFVNIKSQILDEYTSSNDSKIELSIKKPIIDENSLLSLQENNPVPLICKMSPESIDTNHCIILPLNTTNNILNLSNANSENTLLPMTNVNSNNIQYICNTSNVLLEIIDEKPK